MCSFSSYTWFRQVKKLKSALKILKRMINPDLRRQEAGTGQLS